MLLADACALDLAHHDRLADFPGKVKEWLTCWVSSNGFQPTLADHLDQPVLMGVVDPRRTVSLRLVLHSTDLYISGLRQRSLYGRPDLPVLASNDHLVQDDLGYQDGDLRPRLGQLLIVQQPDFCLSPWLRRTSLRAQPDFGLPASGL